jgi:crotonobetainyl-CoA:carnitine CoA-transferase CaiB-like acyl-CoA transferase
LKGPLADLRVLDLSRVLAGPWATQLLADLGAEVIKVERPGSGDDTRHWGPPFLEGTAGDPAPLSAYYLSANRGKKSIAVDVARAEGAELVRDLAERCDVFVENFKVGGLARYGLDHETLRARQPRLVYCSISGFGQTGPYRDQPGYDALIQAMSGLMSITGEPDRGPQKVGVAVADVFTGLYATSAILAALRHRDATDRGQHIDLALLDTQIAVLANQASSHLVSGEVPGRLGTAHPSIVPYQAFETADGRLMLAVGNDAQFGRFCDAADLSALAQDRRFATNPGRVIHRADLLPGIAARLRDKSTAEWVSLLGEVDVPCSPINDLRQVFDDPQVQARGVRLALAGEDGQEVPAVSNPIRFSDTPIEYDLPPPRLGAHSDEVLRSVLGLGADEIRALRERRVVG